jgi:hypothetical protein
MTHAGGYFLNITYLHSYYRIWARPKLFFALSLKNSYGFQLLVGFCLSKVG